MKALPVASAWSLFAPDREARVELARWVQQANTFLGADVGLVQTLGDPRGVLPERAELELLVRRVGGADAGTRVRVRTVPLEEGEALSAARAGVAAIGGAGMDAVLARAQRLWQVDVTPRGEGDARAPLVVAATIALVLLAPIVPPEGGTIFGVRGARTRLEALGWG